MSNIYKIDKIVDWREKKKGKGVKFEFYIKWDGFNSDENTWEPMENLKESQDAYIAAWGLINKHIKKSGYKRKYRRLYNNLLR